LAVRLVFVLTVLLVYYTEPPTPPIYTLSLHDALPISHFLSLLVNSSGLALLIPPSTVMIYYGTLTSTSVGNLFLAGIIPGIAILDRKSTRLNSSHVSNASAVFCLTDDTKLDNRTTGDT